MVHVSSLLPELKYIECRELQVLAGVNPFTSSSKFSSLEDRKRSLGRRGRQGMAVVTRMMFEEAKGVALAQW